MNFEPLDEMLSFWHAWQRWCNLRKNGSQERRGEQLEEEIEYDHPEEENIDHEE